MAKIISWLLTKPEQIPDTSWLAFLENVAFIVIATVLIFIVLILGGYKWSARKRKIHSIYNVFASYTPLLWLLWGGVGAIGVWLYCLWQYPLALGGSEGSLGVATMLALVTLAVTILLSYLLIVTVPWLTPRKFRYRPAPFLHRGK